MYRGDPAITIRRQGDRRELHGLAGLLDFERYLPAKMPLDNIERLYLSGKSRWRVP